MCRSCAPVSCLGCSHAFGKLFWQWDAFGWHRVTVYGDVKEPLAEFGKALGLEVVEEA